jgi:hypothetical protein
VYVFVCIYRYTYIHAYTYIYTYKYPYIYIHIHTQAQYHDLAKALSKEKEAAQDELTKNIEEQNRLRDSIQEAMQKDAFYGTQVYIYIYIYIYIL